MKNEITQEQIDRGAAALRLRYLSGRTIASARPWDRLHDFEKKKWRESSAIVLDAALKETDDYLGPGGIITETIPYE